METELRQVPLAELRHLRRNPQFMSEAEMSALVESVKRDGFLAPVLLRPVDDEAGSGFEIVSGNHRVMAAREAGLETVPAVIAPLDDAQAARIAVNLNTVHGDPTPELLAPFLAELDDDVLATVHLDADLMKGLIDFDAELADQLSRLEAPTSLDTQSANGGRVPDCICPKCGRRHVGLDVV